MNQIRQRVVESYFYEVIFQRWPEILDTFLTLYLGFVVIISFITFMVYGWDKRQAKIAGWRISESRLHWLAFLGGWPGALLGQKFFRHKTQKFNFKFLTWTAAIMHLVGITAMVSMWLNQ